MEPDFNSLIGTFIVSACNMV